MKGPFGYFVFQNDSGQEIAVLRSWVGPLPVEDVSPLGIPRTDVMGRRRYKTVNTGVCLSDAILWEAIRSAHPSPAPGLMVEIFTITTPSFLRSADANANPDRTLYRTALFFSNHWYLLEPPVVQQRQSFTG